MLNENTRSRMAEATRLTKEGRLQEATAIIQGALGTPPVAPPEHEKVGHDFPIDVASRLVRETCDQIVSLVREGLGVAAKE